ncbi:haloacid dehalogenase [Brachybacterium endophyticum]|uniref:Haloacid dehalogenase n=1 Tax=Brachybacterium endophyticum TaxID=2182385 RepID=A0A2U2RI66_9MICO|nr:HAD family hydrolase [Brachybacterium endophyticum]PWH05474.1 haloacid dehalogenase [Brachybacterium endophyticum]
MPDGLDDFRVLLADPDLEVAVSDLDGVLRVFDSALWDRLGTELGLGSGAVFEAILRNPLLEDVTRGRTTHAQWRESNVAELIRRGAEPEAAHHAVSTWAAERGHLDPDVLAALVDAQSRDVDVFVFTNGTDRVRQEIAELRASEQQQPTAGPTAGRDAGLRELLDVQGDHVLNSAELGAIKPDQEAFEAGHRRIQQVLGRTIPRRAVAFLDDSANHVRAAEEFGWRAVRLTRA